MRLSKSSLAVELSRLKVFTKPKAYLEQYPTDSEVAADVLWNAYMLGDISGNSVSDLGAGTGILGIGCLLLGAKSVDFIEIDKQAIETLNENLLDFEDHTIHNKNITNYNKKTDIVMMNPPFGVQKRKADKPFLEKALTTSNIIYYFAKPQAITFLRSFIKEHNVKITHEWSYNFPLKATMKHHKNKIRRIEVNVWRLEQ